SRLLQARSDVDSIAGHERIALSADDDLPGIHADAGLEPVLGDRAAHLDRGADCAQRVVLVRNRYAKNSHDRVPHELLHDAAVALDDRAKILEIAAQTDAQRLRVRRLPKRGRADDVAKDDRDDLPLLPHDLDGAHRRPAGVAETRSIRILVPTGRAGSHGRESRAATDYLVPSPIRDARRPHGSVPPTLLPRAFSARQRTPPSARQCRAASRWPPGPPA